MEQMELMGPRGGYVGTMEQQMEITISGIRV